MHQGCRVRPFRREGPADLPRRARLDRLCPRDAGNARLSLGPYRAGLSTLAWRSMRDMSELGIDELLDLLATLIPELTERPGDDLQLQIRARPRSPARRDFRNTRAIAPFRHPSNCGRALAVAGPGSRRSARSQAALTWSATDRSVVDALTEPPPFRRWRVARAVAKTALFSSFDHCHHRSGADRRRAQAARRERFAPRAGAAR